MPKLRDTPRYWTPLRQLRREEMYTRMEVVQETMAHYQICEEEARALLDRESSRCSYHVNDIYQVEVTEFESVTQLCIRRRDGGMIRDWRHFQQIKNELCGPEREGFELYPAESRKVDTSNKWHIWVHPEGERIPVGYRERDVQYEERRDVPGLRQRVL